MEYGKVKVTGNNTTGYIVRIGLGNDEAYERIEYRRDYAYSEAAWLRGSYKLGKHPGAIVQNHGYKLVKA